jgi:predicted ATPase
MRLLEFRPRGYRALRDLPIFFSFEDEPLENECSIRFLVGRNGTGKTTLLRFIAAIFAALGEGYQRERPDNPAYSADFRLSYQLRGNTIEIRKTGRGRASVEFRMNGAQVDGFLGNEEMIPTNIIIYTSGDLDTWNELLYGAIRDDPPEAEPLPNQLLPQEELPLDQQLAVSVEQTPQMAESVKEGGFQVPMQMPTQIGSGDSEEETGINRIVLVEPPHLALAFLAACVAHYAEGEQGVDLGADFGLVLGHVNIDRLVSFSLRLQYDIGTIGSNQRRKLSRLYKAATLTLQQFDTQLWVFDMDNVRGSERTASRLLPGLGNNARLPFQFFQDLVALQRDGILLEANLIVNKRRSIKQKQSGPLLLFADLSDGERAYLSRVALIQLMAGQSGLESLFLFDEPETHFNDEWKRDLVEQMEQTLTGSHSEVILTTHASIVLTDAFPNEVILMTEEGQQNAPLTFAAEQNELLRSVFGAERSVGKRATNYVRRILNTGTTEQLEDLLDKVGPGYFRYKIIEALDSRVSQNQPS